MPDRLPCRIIVYAEGVECFVYNRTPAYDAIVERMKKHEKEAESNSSTSSESLAKQKSNGTTGTDGSGMGFGTRLRKAAKLAPTEDGNKRDSSSSTGTCSNSVLFADTQTLLRSLLPQTRTLYRLYRSRPRFLLCRVSIGCGKPYLWSCTLSAALSFWAVIPPHRSSSPISRGLTALWRLPM